MESNGWGGGRIIRSQIKGDAFKSIFFSASALLRNVDLEAFVFDLYDKCEVQRLYVSEDLPVQF